MDEVKTNVQRQYDLRLMTRSNERITLDEALGARARTIRRNTG
jgi:hypothetical protein